MKKTIFKYVMAVLMALFSLNAYAYDVEINGIYYNLDANNKVVTVTSGSDKYTGDITIPSSIINNGDTYNVTSIGFGAFYYCSGLTSVTIPNSVTSIGYEAFSGCSGLTSITIPNSVTSIGEGAFAYCSGLTSVTIPNSVTSIKEHAFSGCSGLTSVTIPNSVTSIGFGAFQYCSGLTSVTIPNSVTSIEDEAFSGCSGLTSIVVDLNNPTYDSRDNCNAIIETASNRLVSGCKNTVIPNSVTSIGQTAFLRCTSLTSITIPNGVTSIEAFAFKNCSLTSVTIPNSVTSIGESAFDDCSGLTSVTIPNSVTSIGIGAFQYCSGLTSVVSEIEEPFTFGEYSFDGVAYNCTLTVPAGTRDAYIAAGWTESVFKGGVVEAPASPNITFADANVKTLCVANWDTNNDGELSEAEAAAVNGLGHVFNRNTNITSFNELHYFIGLTTIGSNAFNGCSSLISVTIPNSVTSIGGAAFFYCSGLTSVTIPNSVTSILNQAFEGCSGLTSVTIPNTVTSIGYRTFKGCSGLTSVTIPNTVTSIGNYAFNGCSGLTSVVSEIEEPFSFGDNTFTGIANNCTLTVPYGKRDAYIAAGWTEEIFKGGVMEVPAPTISATGVSLNQTSVTLTSVGQTANLIATVTPADVTDGSVTWTSSNEAVATVSSEGVVTAVANGTATITATTNDGTNLKATALVTVDIPQPTNEDTDISLIDNVVYMERTVAYAGTEQTMSIKMKNTVGIQTVQFDMYLPDGVEVVQDEYDKELIELSTARTTANMMNSLSVQKLSNGAYRVLINFTSGNTFDGNDGEIVKAKVSLSNAITPEDYPVIFRDIVLVNTNSEGYETDYVKCTLTVPDYMPGDVNNDRKVNAIDLNAITNYILERRTFPFTFNTKAADINKDEKINAIDLNAVTNMILHHSASASKRRAVKVGVIDY